MRQATTIKRPAIKELEPKNRFKESLPKDICSKDEFYQMVAEKAYELFVARGCEHGHDVEDWAKAEKIVKGV